MREWLKKFLPTATQLPLHPSLAAKAHGDALLAQGDWPGAELAYRQALALAPNLAKAHGSLGFALQQQGREAEAQASLERARELDAGNPDTHYMLGTLAVKQQGLEAAQQFFAEALRLSPDFEAAHEALCELLLRRRQFPALRLALDAALLHCPASAGLHRLRGELYYEERRFEEAVACYRQALAIDPTLSEAWTSLGLALLRLERHEEAAQAFDGGIEGLRAVSSASPNARALFNLGSALMRVARYAEAADCFDQSLVLDPQPSEVRIARGWLRLLRGDYETGWRDYAEVAQHGPAARRNVGRPLWDGGQELAGKAILLYADQGMGDAIQFLRYVPHLVALGAAAVYLDVQPPLRRLVASVPGATRVLAHGEALADFDFYCPLSSLPAACGTVSTIVPDVVPTVVPYVFAPLQTDTFSATPDSNMLRVGVVWSGNPQFHNDRQRSMQLSDLLPLFDQAACRFCLMQQDLRENDQADFQHLLQSNPRVGDMRPMMDDFADTAAIVATLDLVIAIDSAVAHLAGAMGKPVWILLPHAPDFRWMLERQDSPWYPTARLFRQPRPGDWPAVIAAVIAAVTAALPAAPNRAD